jgi:hypothetical protein
MHFEWDARDARVARIQWRRWTDASSVSSGVTVFDERTDRVVEIAGIRVMVSLSGQGTAWVHASEDLRTWYAFVSSSTREVESESDGANVEGVRFRRFDGDAEWSQVAADGAARPTDVEGADHELLFTPKSGPFEDVGSGRVALGAVAGRVGSSKVVFLVRGREAAVVRIRADEPGFGRRLVEHVRFRAAAHTAVRAAELLSQGSCVVECEKGDPVARFGEFGLRLSTAEDGETWVHFDNRGRCFIAIDALPPDATLQDAARLSSDLEFRRFKGDAAWCARPSER